jgi:hypothetical protein
MCHYIYVHIFMYVYIFGDASAHDEDALLGQRRRKDQQQPRDVERIEQLARHSATYRVAARARRGNARRCNVVPQCAGRAVANTGCYMGT